MVYEQIGITPTELERLISLKREALIIGQTPRQQKDRIFEQYVQPAFDRRDALALETLRDLAPILLRTDISLKRFEIQTPPRVAP